MAVLSCEHYCPARSADGIGDKAISEDHSLIRQTIQVWCVDQFIAICADCLIAMVIRHDVQKIRWVFWDIIFRSALQKQYGKK